MILKHKQIREIFNIIDKNHLIYIASTIGKDVLSKEDIFILRSFGIDLKDFTKEGLVEDAFKFGILADSLSHNQLKGKKFKDVKNFIRDKRYIPLGTQEKYAIEVIKYQSYGDIKNLASKVKFSLNNKIVTSQKENRKIYEHILKTKSIERIEKRKSMSWLKSQLGELTGDWVRDLDRVIDYTSHTATDQGKAYAIMDKHGEDAEVFKYVMPNACKHCISAYLTGGEGSEPKVFKLKDIMANGNNIGKKQSEWLPVLGPHHPFCRCETNYKDPMYTWDEDKGAFTKLKSNGERKRKSRAKISIS